jgi:hypothetical protein
MNIALELKDNQIDKLQEIFNTVSSNEQTFLKSNDEILNEFKNQTDYFNRIVGLHTGSFSNSHSMKRFKSEEKFIQMYKYTSDILSIHGMNQKCIFCPPLFVRSKEPIVFKIHNMVIIGNEHGPIIPIVLTTVNDCRKYLSKLYSMKSPHDLTSNMFKMLLIS